MFARHSESLLLRNPEVEKELKITPEQKSQLAAVNTERERWFERATREFQQGKQKLADNGAGPDQVQALARQQSELAQERREDFDAALVKVLSAKQRERLAQIKLQAEGPMAFTRPEIQQRLNMDEEQVAMIGEIVAEGRAALSQEAALPPELRPARPLSAEEREQLHSSQAYKTAVGKTRTAAIEVRERTMQAIAKVLTKKQRDKYQSMRGEPFGLDKMQATPGNSSRPTAPK